MLEERVTTSDWDVKSGKIIPIFKKNTPFPTEEKLNFPITFNNQISIEFQIFKDAKPYKWCILEIPPTKKGKRVELFFEIDENGVFSCKGNIKEVDSVSEYYKGLILANFDIPPYTTYFDSISEYYKGLLSNGNYYNILGIDENAPQHDVNDAFASKSLKFNFDPEIKQMIFTANEKINTEDKRKRLYLRNVITNFFRKWKIDVQHDEKIPYLVNEFMKSTDSYCSLKNRGRGYIQNKICEIEKPPPLEMMIDEKNYTLITKDEGRDGTTLSFTKKNLITGKEEGLEIPIPPDTLSDRDVRVEGKGNPHDYIPNLKGDVIIKVKVIPIDAIAIFEEIKKDLREDLKDNDKKNIIKDIREEVRRKYHISDDISIIRQIAVDVLAKFLNAEGVELANRASELIIKGNFNLANDLLRKAEGKIEEAIKKDPTNSTYNTNLSQVRDNISQSLNAEGVELANRASEIIKTDFSNANDLIGNYAGSFAYSNRWSSYNYPKTHSKISSDSVKEWVANIRIPLWLVVIILFILGLLLI